MAGVAGARRTEGVVWRAMRIGYEAEDGQAQRPVAGAVGGAPPKGWRVQGAEFGPKRGCWRWPRSPRAGSPEAMSKGLAL